MGWAPPSQASMLIIDINNISFSRLTLPNQNSQSNPLLTASTPQIIHSNLCHKKKKTAVSIFQYYQFNTIKLLFSPIFTYNAPNRELSRNIWLNMDINRQRLLCAAFVSTNGRVK